MIGDKSNIPAPTPLGVTFKNAILFAVFTKPEVWLFTPHGTYDLTFTLPAIVGPSNTVNITGDDAGIN